MIPAIILSVLALMSALGWLADVSKTRRFWLFWRRMGRFWRWSKGDYDAVGAAYDVYDSIHHHRLLTNAMTPRQASEWMHRYTRRAIRFHAGVPVFSNKVFTL